MKKLIMMSLMTIAILSAVACKADNGGDKKADVVLTRGNVEIAATSTLAGGGTTAPVTAITLGADTTTVLTAQTATALETEILAKMRLLHRKTCMQLQ